MAGKRHDWRAYKLEYIARRLNGEELTISAFADQKGAGRSAMSTRLRGWKEELAERQTRVEDATLSRIEIDQIARRVDLLQTLDEMKPGIYPMLRAWAKNKRIVALKFLEEMERTGRQPSNKKLFEAEISAKEIKQMLDIFEKLSVSGAGLPREHVVMHDDVHEDLRASRKQMQDLQQSGMELVDFVAKRRAKAKK